MNTIRSMLLLLVGVMYLVQGCRTAKPTGNGGVVGIFQFTSDYDRQHGTDLLVIGSDNTYFHYYRSPASDKPYTQTGRWRFFFDKANGEEILFDDFLPWGIKGWAGRHATLDTTAPSRTAMKIDDYGAVVELEVDPDIHSYFVKLH